MARPVKRPAPSDEYCVCANGGDDAPDNGTVSEARGYGMNIVPLMAGDHWNPAAS